MPLRGAGPILEPTATGRGIATQLPRDRRRRTPEPPRDLPHAATTRAKKSDLLPLAERQVTPRRRAQGDRWHPATLPKPADANRSRHARLGRRRLARQAASDRRPEPLAVLLPPRRRTSRRPH